MTYQTTLISGSGYGNTFIDSLIYGDGWVGSVITYSLNSGYTYGIKFGSIYGDNWNLSERSAIASVFSSYSAVCNLTFQNVTDNSSSSNLAFWSLSSWYMGLYQGAFDSPNGDYSQLYGYFNYSDPGWSYLQPGGQGYEVLVHEIGHALGLAHPHDGGGEIDRTIFPGVTSEFSTGTYDLNQRIWTVMSYNEGWNQRPSYTDAYGDVSTPMAFDIAALQAIYGANNSYNTGNNIYILDSMNGQGTDWSCIWDAGGTDTISNASSSIACIINLNEAPLVGVNAGGYVSAVNGICGGFTIAHNVTIENAIGGSGGDIIIGNAADNNLIGGLGSDVIDGGSGTDYVWYLFARSNYTITYLSGVYTIVALTGGEGQDQVIGAEYFQFSDQALSVADLDFIAPSVTTFSPLDAATGVAIGSDIAVTFSENIQRGTGNILLKDAANNVIATYDAATSTNLNIIGSTLTINPTSDLGYSTDYYVTFASGAIQDLAGNNYAGTTTYNFVTGVAPDTTAPTIAISTNDSAFMVGETATISFTLSEASTDFVVGDVSVSGGALSDFIGSGTNYSATFTPTANSTTNGVVSVASSKFSDAAGNLNADGSDGNNTVTMSVDTVRPTIAISTNDSAFMVGETATISFTLSEASTDFVVGDVSVSGGALSDFIGSGTNYSATFTPTESSTTNGVVSVASSKFSDAAGNLNADGSDGNNTVTMSVDTMRPTVSTFSPADNATVVAINSNMLVTFSEFVQFGSGNIEIHAGSAAGTLLAAYNVASPGSNLSISGSVLTINPTSDLGYSTDYYVTFASGAIQDLAGNNYAGTTTYNFVTDVAANHSPILNPDLSRQDTVLEDTTTTIVLGSYFNTGSLGTVDGVTDADGTPASSIGIAITGVNGVVVGLAEYSHDGVNWFNLNPNNLPVSESNALLLSGFDYLRYTPPQDTVGTRTITFHAWDGSGGYATGDFVNLTGLGVGGSSPFSEASATETLTIASCLGTPGSETISGDSANDIIVGGLGNDTIDGGAGADVADYSSSLSDYAIIKSGSQYYVSGADGNDTLLNVERLTFNDFSVNLTIQGTATSGVTADEVNKIAELYVAYFNRVPEADGLEYWINTYKNGVSMADISRTFYDVGIQYSELTGYTSSMSLESFIGVVYQNVLGRDEVDAGGLEFWVTSITEGRQTRQDLVASILSAAHTYKLDPVWHHVPDLLDNKIVVANYFAVQNGLNYLSPEDSITQGMAMAAGITSTDTTAAIELIGVHDIEIMVV